MRLFVFSKSEKGSSIITFVTYFYSFLFCCVVLQLLTYISNFSLSEATIPFSSTSLSEPFQFAPLCERLLFYSCRGLTSLDLFQFTSLCERLPAPWHREPGRHPISIHASLREATFIDCLSVASASISIHASLREATVNGDKTVNAVFISIHASLREATKGHFYGSYRQDYFNSRLSARGYSKILKFPSSSLNFNSRLSARGYNFKMQLGQVAGLFQFTPLCERLLANGYGKTTSAIFQFTPLCERLRRPISMGVQCFRISIHASLREAT